MSCKRLPWADTLISALLAVTAACGAGGGVAGQDPTDAAPGRSLEESQPAAPAPRAAGRVTFPSGKTFFVDLAVTPSEQARGYMGRREIDPEEGLLFIYRRAGIRTFWMKNCLVPLDIIWLDRQNRVVHIEHETPPCEQDPCPSYGPSVPTFNVLEVAAGTARQERLQPGQQLEVVTDQGTP